MKSIKLFIIIFLAVAGNVWAHADLFISFKTNFNNAPVAYNTAMVYNGTNFELSHLGYFISNIKIIKDDLTERIIDTVILVKADVPFTLQTAIGTGNYTAIKFDVGIADSLVNHGDPSVYPANHPLALQTPSMHWSWSTGYIFLRLDGQVDTSSDQSSGLNQNMTFHLGKLSSVRTVTVNRNFYIDGSYDNGHNEYTAEVVFNLDEMFSGIDLKTDNVTMTMNNPALAAQAADNLLNAFDFSEPQLVLSTGKEYVLENNLKLYPNPAQNQITMEIQDEKLLNGTFIITDFTGKTVRSFKAASTLINFSLSELPAGLYFVRHSQSNLKSLRLMVQ